MEKNTEKSMGENIELRLINVDAIEDIKSFFYDIFTKEPWCDDWSDNNQLHAYIMDLIGNSNSLAMGLYEDSIMVGLSMGSIKHWYSGTEYCIDEFCIKTKVQGRGLGTRFIKEIEAYIKEKGMKHMFLQTERTVPAYDFYIKSGFVELKDHVSLVKQC